MRRSAMRAALLAITFGAIGGIATAQEVVIEAQPGGAGGGYSELSGAWADSAASSTASSLSVPGSRALAPASGKLAGGARFEATLAEGGKYAVELAWPADANAAGVTIIVRGPEGETRSTLDIAPTGSGAWAKISDVYLGAGSRVSVDVLADSALGPVDPTSAFSLAIDAVRFLRVGDAPAATDSPFGDPIEADPSNPFGDVAVTDEASTDNPFKSSATPVPEFQAPPAAPETADVPSDPFGAAAAAAATPVSSPVARPAIAQADPFGAGPDAATTASASDVTMPDDPFGGDAPAAEPAIPENPFGNAETQNDMGDLPRQNASRVVIPDDPFGSPAPAADASSLSLPDDPFASPVAAAAATPRPSSSTRADSLALPDDPFASAPTTTASTATASNISIPADPFASSSAPADASAVSIPTDPFASTTVSAPPATATPAAAAAASWGAERGTATIVGEGNIDSILSPQETKTQKVLRFLESVDEGKAAAAKSRKPVLVLFSGRSVQAEMFEETLNNPAVVEALQVFELVRVDYRKNRAVAQSFAVTSYPYLVVLNWQGFAISHMAPISNPELLIEELSPLAKPAYLK